MVLNRDGIILDGNATGPILHNIPARNIYGSSLTDLFPDWGQTLLNRIRETAVFPAGIQLEIAGCGIFDAVIQQVDPDNTRPDPLYTVILHDITARETARRQLQRENRLKEEILTVISHDFCGPIGVVQSILNRTAGNAPGLQTGDRELLLESARQLATVHRQMNNLLLWIRHADPARPLNAEPFSLHRVLSDAIELLHDGFEQKKIHLQLTEIPLQCILSADPETVTAILRNLLANAVKFTPRNGTVTVSVSETAESASITVQDNGNGFPRELLQSFRQRSVLKPGNDTENRRSTGMGLPLAHSLSIYNRGSLHLCNNNGACAILTLPRYIENTPTRKLVS